MRKAGSGEWKLYNYPQLYSKVLQTASFLSSHTITVPATEIHTRCNCYRIGSCDKAGVAQPSALCWRLTQLVILCWIIQYVTQQCLCWRVTDQCPVLRSNNAALQCPVLQNSTCPVLGRDRVVIFVEQYQCPLLESDRTVSFVGVKEQGPELGN